MEIYCSYIRHNWFAIEWKVNFHQTLADLKRFLHIFTWNGRQKRHETTIYEFERLYSYCEERGVELNADKKTIDNYQRWRARKKFIKKQRKNDQLEIALWTDSQDHQLKPYQKIGVNTVMAARRFILADQVGVGKTPQAIGVMLKAWEEYNGDCALLVCPNRIKGQWKKELLAFTKLKEDDITIFGDPEDIFDETDDGGEVTKMGALSLLIQELKARGLDCNRIKFACAGTTQDACARKPSWLKEPTTIEATDGSIIHARGIDICNNPIGEDLYVQTFLANKLESICKAIKESSDRLSASSRHANFLAFYHSYKARFDY
jgi:hypothetical protein